MTSVNLLSSLNDRRNQQPSKGEAKMPVSKKWKTRLEEIVVEMTVLKEEYDEENDPDKRAAIQARFESAKNKLEILTKVAETDAIVRDNTDLAQEVFASIQELVNENSSFASDAIKLLINTYLKVVDDLIEERKGLAKLRAENLRMQYNAYKDAGFSVEEAMQLVMIKASHETSFVSTVVKGAGAVLDKTNVKKNDR